MQPCDLHSHGFAAQFIRGGVSAFTLTFAAPAFLSDIARAQGARARNLVVVYLSGGNDALSTVVPYQDPFYFSRRPTICRSPRGRCCRSGPTRAGARSGSTRGSPACAKSSTAAGLPSSSGPATPNSSRSHFQGSDIWGTSDPTLKMTDGWLGRYLERLPEDPLIGWSATQELPRALVSREVERGGDSRMPAPTRSSAPTPAPRRRASARRPPRSRRICPGNGRSWRS